MSATTISVARILDSGVAIAWQEAVEVAQSADRLSLESGAPISLAGCLISTKGEVRLADNQWMGATLTAVQLLRRMLDGQPAPDDLHALIESADDSLASFPSENAADSRPLLDLRAFIGPDTREQVGRLAARALAAESARADEVPSAGERAADAAPLTRTQPRHGRSEAASRPRPVQRNRRDTLRRWVLFHQEQLLRGAIAAAVLGLTASAIYLLIQPWPTSAESEPVVEAPADAGPPADAARSAAMPGAVPADAGSAPPEVTASVTASASRRSAAPPARPSTVPARAGEAPPSRLRDVAAAPATPVAPARRTPSTVALPPVVRPTSRETAGGAETAPARGASIPERRVYSSADADVVPPELLRPQLPSEPKIDSEQSDATIEVVVDENGQVAQVRLRSSDPLLADRMIVAAAKAWQFRPATKDGHPVKYLLQLPVTR